jgi:uncharacterized protein YndB with AHSA1/START domain
VSYASAACDGDTVLASVGISATAQRVFQALTTPEMEVWWGTPDFCRVEKWCAELCIGGRWSLAVRLSDGRLLPASGMFLTIDPPNRLVLTRRYDFDHPTLGRRETAITYDLTSLVNGGTHLNVRQDGFGGILAAAEEHRQDWQRQLSWLAAYLRSNA